MPTNSNGLNSYATFNPNIPGAPNQPRPGQPGTSGWIDPTVPRSNSMGYTPSYNLADEFNAANPVNMMDLSPSQMLARNSEMTKWAASQTSRTQPNAKGYTDPTPTTPAPSGGGNNPGGNNSATPGAMRSLTNRRPALANAWSGWSNNQQGQGNNPTQFGNANFAYHSRFA